MWLKTADSSTACETSTLKSPLLLESDAPHVHPRLRKRLARCTLDCGFKPPESPALRGFEAERGPIRGTSLYLVLKSNGPHRSKKLPVKFGFSSKIVPANIVKKLPSQRCFKPLFIPLFNFSHKQPTFAFMGKNGYTLGVPIKIAHGGSHAETGAFPSANIVWLCAASEIPFIPPCFYFTKFCIFCQESSALLYESALPDANRKRGLRFDPRPDPRAEKTGRKQRNGAHLRVMRFCGKPAYCR